MLHCIYIYIHMQVQVQAQHEARVGVVGGSERDNDSSSRPRFDACIDTYLAFREDARQRPKPIQRYLRYTVIARACLPTLTQPNPANDQHHA